MIDRLVVKCRAASHKRGRVATVVTFERGEDTTAAVMRVLAAARGDEDVPTTTGTPMWRQVVPPGKQGGGTHANVDKLASMTQLVGDTVTKVHWTEPQPDPATVRDRYRLRCPLCGLNALARAERLDPVLSAFADAGIDTVELSVLEHALRRVVL
jgi:hypothetical protein